MAWVCDLLGLRKRTAGGRMVWGVALSFAVVPIAAVELGKYGSLSAVCWAALLCAAAMLGLVAWEAWSRRSESETSRLGPGGLVWLGIGAAWAVFAVGELVDVGVGSRLYMSVTVYDHSMRTAFVDAVLRGGVPPANPLYWPGHAAPMRYYYFWYVVAAAAARLAGAAPRQAMIASVVWAGLALAAMVALFCRHFLGGEGGGEPLFREGGRRPRIALALGLLTVTGLDILPAIAKAIARLPTDADADWWSFDQVGSWMDSVLWVPHHIAGLVCCLFGLLLVWVSKDRSGWRRWMCGVVAGISFASAFGLSTWIAFAFALAMLGWLVWVVAWEAESRARVPVLLVAAVVAMMALLPFLRELRHAESGASVARAHGTNGENPIGQTAAQGARSATANNGLHLLRFGVRHMIDPDALLALPGFAGLARSHPQVEDAIAGLILLFPGYFMELGFYGLALWAAIPSMRRGRLGEAERTALALVFVGLVVSSVLRSTVVVNNDFGVRSILIAQFFLLLLAVRWCEGGFGDAGRWMRIVAGVMLCLGVAGTVYQAVALRVYLPLEERLGRPAVGGLSEEAMALHRGLTAMDTRTPKDAVVQFNTQQPSDYFRYAQILFAGRQIAAALPDCPAAFGGDASRCGSVEEGVAELFLPVGVTGGAPSADGARAVCGRLGISYLIATQRDGVWADRGGWVWELPAVVDTGQLRVVECGR
jgi:hypothetical protein